MNDTCDVIILMTSPKPQTKPTIINSMTHSDVIIGQVVTSLFKLHKEAPFVVSPGSPLFP